MEVSLIFPGQVYEFNPCVNTGRKIYIIEDYHYFGINKFHKQKLVLHRATLKFYCQYLVKYGLDVEYIDYNGAGNLGEIFKSLARQGVKKIHHGETVDYRLELQINKFCRDYGMTRKLYDTPNFLVKHDEISNYFDNEKYSMMDFYIRQRKKLGILMKNDKPVGGKWNFDSENRKKLPDNAEVPAIKFPEKNKYVYEAIEYVNKNFPDNVGVASDFNYPVTFQSAIQFLDDFLLNRLSAYGVYQDAIVSNKPFLFHSLLSPLLNTGILSPDYVVNRTIEFHEDYEYPLNSIENFIRQIIGWREFIRAVYVLEGNRQRNSNYWGVQKPVPDKFYTANTGVLPVDDSISKVLKYSWCHHNERLMLLGNFMQLCGFSPDSIYDWFMTMFIDSYEWILVPNIYGISQYADGGLISPKPYFSGSDYIIKMSNYSRGEWSDIWDALYMR
ncbi:MAG: cryptochrome/photolyase family protein, partial [Candidatus Kapabacteria bacterium]|nr:cryptochrome/photolyase family protein [Candidatus Kapabacteria bacterium]